MTELPDYNARIAAEFRANAGRVGGSFEGRSLLLLHTIGARSGAPRLSPLAYVTVDGRMLIIGSYAGAPKDPAWVHNLRAHPRARIEVGTDTRDVTARELRGAERAAVYPKVVAAADHLAEHQARTTRVIPIFELTH